MENAEILQKINQLLAELKALQPLAIKHEQRLWKKLRLEWNYNSNHIEGNTLTYGETELLIYKGDTLGQHSIREYDEMKGHDLALHMVVNLAKETERDLNEQFIRELNETLLKEPYWKPAITETGQATQKQVIPGKYKSSPNSVRTSTGELFHYASPEETPAKMNDLLDWYKTNINVSAIELAADLHYRFVRIHPFDDGNGRVARLLMNYVLLKHGYPPAVIKSADKANYLRALNRADIGDIAAFRDYIAAQVVWSLELSIKAAKGANIEEEGDLDKEIEVLKRQLKNSPEIIEESFESKLVLFKEAFSPMMEKVFLSIDKLRDEFKEVLPRFTINGGIVFKYSIELNVLEKVLEMEGKHISAFNFHYLLNDFKKSGLNTFNAQTSFNFQFEKYHYQVVDCRGEIALKKQYNEILTQNEKTKIADGAIRFVLETIQKNLKS